MTQDQCFKAGMRRLAYFECSLLSFVGAGTHQIFIGEVMAVHLGNRGRPLLYCDGSFSTLAA